MKKLLMIMILLLLAGITGCQKENPDLDRVNQEIDAFIETYVTDYVADTKQDIYVMRSLALLEDNGYDISLADYVTQEVVEAKYDGATYESIASIYQGIIIMDLYDLAPSAAVTALGTLETTEAYNHVIAYLSLKKTNTNPTLAETLLSQILVVRMEDYRDPDFAGMALMATASLDVDRSQLLDLITLYATVDGIGTPWGGANSCSTALSMLGLLAIGEDPTAFHEIDLVKALLTFTVDGAAKYDLSGETDLQFSTPQVFAALVAYKIFAEKNVAVNLLG